MLTGKVAFSGGSRKPPQESHHAPKKWIQRYKSGRDALTVGETAVLLQACRGTEERALLGLALAAGLRREDVVGVENGKIREESDSEGTTLLVAFWEKKKRREWEVRTAGGEVPAILDQMTQSRKSRWLFPGHQGGGKHMSSRTAYNIFQRVLKRAGLRARPFHALRATCIKNCQRAGWAPEQVAELTGDTIRVIQEHYSTPSDDEMREVAAKKPPVPKSLLLRALRDRPIT